MYTLSGAPDFVYSNICLISSLCFAKGCMQMHFKKQINNKNRIMQCISHRMSRATWIFCTKLCFLLPLIWSSFKKQANMHVGGAEMKCNMMVYPALVKKQTSQMEVLMAPAEVVQALYVIILHIYWYVGFFSKKKENIQTHRPFFVAMNKITAYPSHLLKFQQMPIHLLDNDIHDLTGGRICADLVMMFWSCGVRSLSCFQHPSLGEID